MQIFQEAQNLAEVRLVHYLELLRQLDGGHRQVHAVRLARRELLYFLLRRLHHVLHDLVIMKAF